MATLQGHPGTVYNVALFPDGQLLVSSGRSHATFANMVGGAVVVVLFGYAMSWIFAAVGLAVHEPEAAQAASFPVMAPLVSASGAFVPVASMPDWLQTFANHQPVSNATTAVRALKVGGSTFSSADVWHSLLWDLAILVVAVPLAARLYRRAV